MATVTRASGITLTLPASIELVQVPPPARRTRAQRRRDSSSGLPQDAPEQRSEHDALLAALANQDLLEVDRLPLSPTVEATPPEGRRPRGAEKVTARSPVQVSVPLQPGEHAVVLVEQDGVYSWLLPDDVTPAGPGRPTRGPRTPAAANGGRIARFQIDVRANAGTSATPRSLLPEVLLRPATAFVLRFVLPPVVGKVVSVLEKHVETGLIEITEVDPRTWRTADPGPPIAVPGNRPVRVLLLVHGTFSSTVGCYAAVPLSAAGHQFLSAALGAYDLVLGYDHKTLSLDPLENATDLLDRLRSRVGDRTVELDVVCHSRGGLVARSLVELIGPTAAWRPEVQRVVFVACTNRGTLLAAPENWKTLVDVYSNLALGGIRAIGLLPQTQLFAAIANGVVQGVGVLVKALAEEAVGEQGVPGLAAMDPGGAFVRQLNQTQPGQPDPLHSSYFVVTSNFQVHAAGGPPPGLPSRLLKVLEDGLIDRLMNEPNDLVVDDASMAAIDPSVAGFVDARLDLGANGAVYHTNYFSDQPVVDQLASWLELG